MFSRPRLGLHVLPSAVDLGVLLDYLYLSVDIIFNIIKNLISSKV